ncbi:MAG: hypothetical protein QME54_05415 [Actinomycetota bacterium]|nr:hypothetical protein [Actinomycetota bacterium]
MFEDKTKFMPRYYCTKLYCQYFSVNKNGCTRIKCIFPSQIRDKVKRLMDIVAEAKRK